MEPSEVEVYRFKLEVKEKMRSDYRATYSVVYNTTKKHFLEKITDDDMRELVSFQLPSEVS